MMKRQDKKACFGGRFFFDCWGRPIPTKSNVDYLHGLCSDMYEFIKAIDENDEFWDIADSVAIDAEAILAKAEGRE